MADKKKNKKLDRDDIQMVDPGRLDITSVRGKHEKKRREKISKEEKALRRQKKCEERKQKRLLRKEQRSEESRKSFVLSLFCTILRRLKPSVSRYLSDLR